MGKINLLESNIFNRIAAGEVVERPASIVKELIENSIDAGANQLTIEVFGGGIDKIIITDNGCGIELDSVEKAFLPHATSKIATVDDLDNIATLGFRGEALPSIASVSIVEMITKSAIDDYGTKIIYKGGIKESYENIDTNIGTKLTIQNVFFNTPARQKFLKSPKGEESEISYVVSGLILSNPNVSFKYFTDNKLIYSTLGNGLENCIYAIFPTKTAQKLIPINKKINNITVQGYTSETSETRSNRSYEYTIINGRLINNSTINTAVMQAYGNRLMKRMFPVFVLDIIMPFDMLDVNVTPSKTDVRFVDNRQMFSAVYHAVEDALINANNVFSLEDNLAINARISAEKASNTTLSSNTVLSDIKYVVTDAIKSNYEPQVKVADSKLAINKDILSKDCNNAINHDKKNTTMPLSNDTATNIVTKPNELIESLRNITADKKSEYSGQRISSVVRDAISNISTAAPSTKSISTKNTEFQQSTLFDSVEHLLDNNFQILGQLFATYLLVTRDTDLYIIDQHAAHEKMLYDKITEQMLNQNIVTQTLLLPEIIELSPLDSNYLSTLVDDFQKLGLDIEEFGVNTFKVSSVPMILKNFKLKAFIDEVLRDKNKLATIKLKDILHNNLAIIACKSAIKSGDKLNDTQINGLLNMMRDNMPMQCPHGRPAIIKVTQKDIDKLFKRIL